MKPNLSVNFLGRKFKTPLISVSGIVTDIKENLKLARIKGISAVTSKSISINPREGHPLPVISSFGAGFINAVGLKNPGVKKAVREIRAFKQKTEKWLIVSIFSGQLSEFSILAGQVAKEKPNFIELNLSCPNVDDEFGKPFAIDPLLSAMAVLEVKKTVKNIPIIVKLTPNTPFLKQVAIEVEKAGADAVSAINTVGPGLLINVHSRKAILSNRVGGVSGPAIKPVALRCVNEIAKAIKIPVIGIGGISSGKDALEMIMAGADLVGVGSAIFTNGYSIFDKIQKEMNEIMKKEKIKDLKQIKGVI